MITATLKLEKTPRVLGAAGYEKTPGGGVATNGATNPWLRAISGTLLLRSYADAVSIECGNDAITSKATLP